MKDLFKVILLCYLIVAGVILPFSSFRQVVGEIRPYDSTKIWIHGSTPEPMNCKHIYTAVHEQEIKVRSQYPAANLHPINLPDTIVTGKKEGQLLVCVKCFHLTKQILDYGE